ncbi:MAG TPA: VIT1/CCC1 transporter family protein [Egibacteraceae bacterium]|nr:VIT1/CCC1 transporter family protein [Egibacteraceae bacterium]
MPPDGYSPEELDQFEEFWRDERAAAALYRGLAAIVGDDRAELFEELAATEERHAEHWRGLLADAGRRPSAAASPWGHRLLLWRARRFGVERVVPSIIRAEAGDRDRYRSVSAAAPGMADEEGAHGRSLAAAFHSSVAAGLVMADARHRIGAGGALRATVFGANDGLVSNFALIMGVAGGTSEPGVILLAGVAGLVAGAGSMAAGEWVSVQSQRELHERELAVERWELAHFPEDEAHELELIYRAKGLDETEARALVERIMADPEVALDTLAREELGLNPSDLGSPWAAAISSFLSFAAGALVPLVPFLFATGQGAIIGSGVAAGLGLATVGAVISRFTGRPAWISALRMVAIGGGTALVTFLIGTALGVTLD